MRELSKSELSFVSGGGVLDNLASTASKYGEAALAGAVISQAPKVVMSTSMTATQGSIAGIGVTMAATAGWKTGTYLYEDTFVGTTINKGIDKLIDYQINNNP